MRPTGRRGPATADRFRWMDHLRAVAIVAVVFHHAVDAFPEWQRGAPPAAMTVIDLLLSPFRIPLLMLLSGMLLGRSLARPGRTYFAGKLRRIGWPYLVWTTIVLLLVGQLLNLGDIWLILIPATHLWYLWALLWYYAVAYLLGKGPMWVWIASIPVAVAAASLADSRVLYLWPFFVFGHLLSSSCWLAQLLQRWAIRVPLIMIAGTVAVLSAIGWEIEYEPVYLAVVLASVLAIVHPFNPPTSTWWAATLDYVGTRSLVFYCVHWCAIGVLARVMANVGWDRPVSGIAGAAAFGLTASWIFAVGADHSRVVSALFTFPTPRRPKREPSDNRATAPPETPERGV